MQVVAIYQTEEELSQLELPLFSSLLPAGFPNPASTHSVHLDLNTYLIKRPATTYFVKVEGDSMFPAIHSGSLLVIDRSAFPQNGKVVVAVVDGELTVKRICYQDDKVFLVPDNQLYPAKEITSFEHFEIQGVVLHAIHQP